jgi:hypothetical protein
MKMDVGNVVEVEFSDVLTLKLVTGNLVLHVVMRHVFIRHP